MRSKRILVVDDDRDVADTLALIMQRDGHIVEVVYDGEAAVAKSGIASFDIAFIDIMLPGMDGVECLARLRQANLDMKTYMMIGYSGPALLDAALKEGASAVLRKPVMPQDILSRLAEAA